MNSVEQKVLDNLPGLAAVYMMQQQSLLSVMGMQGVMPVQQQVYPSEQAEMPIQAVGQEQPVTGDKNVSGNKDYTEEDVKKYQMDPDINELLDFSFCGE